MRAYYKHEDQNGNQFYIDIDSGVCLNDKFEYAGQMNEVGMKILKQIELEDLLLRGANDGND